MVQKMFAGLKFDNSYVELPGDFYENILPISVEAANLIQLNEELAKELMLDAQELNSKKGTEFLSGNFIAPVSSPIALAYADHQFSHFIP